MKNAKRILTLLLAVVMVANVFAVSAFAADEAALTISFSTPNATVEAGSTFDVIINFKGSESNPIWGGGGIPVCYNSEYVSTGLSDMGVLGTWAENSIIDTENMVFGESNYPDLISYTADETSVYAWDTYKVAHYTTNNFTTTNVSAGEDVLKLTFTVAEGLADGTEIYVGIPKTCVSLDGTCELYLYNGTTGESYEGNTNWDFMDFVYNYNIDAALVKVTVGSAADPEVTHEKFMGRMDNWIDTTATNFDAGFVGKISNLDVEFADDGKQVENITSIVVEITRGEETLTGNAYQIYAQADGSYLFRAVVKNANIADSETVSYKYIVTLSNGEELTAEGTTSFASIYADAKANYDAANP